MRAWFHCSGAALLTAEPEAVIGKLASMQQQRGFAGAAEQDYAWREKIAALRAAISSAAGQDWTIALEFELTRLERRIDAVVLTDRAIICCEFKTGAPTLDGLRQAEDYALRLRDFHAGSRRHRILPLLVAGDGGFDVPVQSTLDLAGIMPAAKTGTTGLSDAFAWAQRQVEPAEVPLDAAAWLAAAYEPVPTIIEAARRLFQKHDVVNMGIARADPGNLTVTTDAIARAIATAQQEQRRIVVFVTGIPGAGKTLCGLNTVFRSNAKAAFLTGNSPLVAVLRGALLRDALRRQQRDPVRVREEVDGFIQDMHNFFRLHAPGGMPPEDVIVFDEAQRAWDARKATRPAQNRRTNLTMSEPAHALDIMARRPGWSVIIALIGNGQEINTGEAGLAEWGRAIAANGNWHALAPQRTIAATDPLQRLGQGDEPWLSLDEELDLTVPIRAIRNPAIADWVAAILENDTPLAKRMAAGTALPVFVSRDLDAVRNALRRFARGTRRAGLVRSAGAKRLRGEGLAAEVARDQVVDWFLTSFPDDIRASDALEAAATEYACQGLELDVVGVAWHLDFHRSRSGWAARKLSGKKWTRDDAEFHYVRNTYRVLLTRARYETVIWVPRGTPRGGDLYDRTRDAAELDAIADFLLACGAHQLEAAPAVIPQAPALLI